MEQAEAFEKLSGLIYEHSGIMLDKSKESLISSRTRKRMMNLNMAKMADYLEYVINDREGMELIILIDSISTNVTYFYREHSHFDFLGGKIREWAAAGQRNFRIWSAGCSSGEEPYTMAFTAAEALTGVNAGFKILATDISTRMLGKAHQGMYDTKSVEKVPEERLKMFFDRLSGDGKDFYRVRQEIRDSVMMKQLNLSVTPYPPKGGIDFIFCRNVMIYFDRMLRKKIADEFCRLLKPGGFLAVSQTESLMDIDIGLKNMGNSIYRKE